MSRILPGTRALRTIEAAGRHLSFTRAAEEVGLTPAAVSYQVKEIEDQLGFALFTRHRRGIELTPAGTLLFEAVVDALGGMRRAVARARRAMQEDAPLRISMAPRFATNWLMPRLSRFRDAHPGLDLSFDVTDRVRDFDEDDVDVAIRFGRGVHEHVHADFLFGTEVVAVGGPALRKAGKRPASPRELRQHTLCYVDCETDGLTWPGWRAWMAAAGVKNFDDSRCVAFSDTSHVVQAVADGGAIGLVEPAMIEPELAQGRLVKLFELSVALPAPYGYRLVYPQSAAGDARVQALREWMLAEVASSTHIARE
jgi:LysR family glycine cleavage system transcriptional activator